jgi:hypothetical protein
LVSPDIDVKTVVAVADGKRHMQVKFPAKPSGEDADKKRETTESTSKPESNDQPEEEA